MVIVFQREYFQVRIGEARLGRGDVKQNNDGCAEKGRMQMQKESLVAVMTGANRGNGLEVLRQLVRRGMRVFLGSRDLSWLDCH